MIKKEILALSQKAGFVIDDSKTVDWSSDYTKELNQFSDLLVKDILKLVDNAETAQKIKTKYGIK